ncbi:MAG TPA: RNA polymerase sigma factor [Conexibacter sp.]|jgi:RNA polymerase sigma factor (sigma-70 family)|nr:RNA polymerase sigma factor [Conexibacter sp.]
MTNATDALLWERIRSGDAEAFGDLYERHARSVQSYCLRRTADLQLAEDATATVFLETWRRRRRIALTTDSAVPLLLGVATNVLRQHWRGRRRYAAAVERVRGATPAGAPGHEDDVIARVDAMRRLREASGALHDLPRREREVLALVAWGELTYEETAAALGVPIGTVRSRLARARARLGDAFPSQLPACIPVEEPLR